MSDDRLNNDFDSRLRDRVSGHETAPDSGVWGSLENKLGAMSALKYKRRAATFQWTSVGLVVAVVILAIPYFTGDKEPVENLYTPNGSLAQAERIESQGDVIAETPDDASDIVIDRVEGNESYAPVLPMDNDPLPVAQNAPQGQASNGVVVAGQPVQNQGVNNQAQPNNVALAAVAHNGQASTPVAQNGASTENVPVLITPVSIEPEQLPAAMIDKGPWEIPVDPAMLKPLTESRHTLTAFASPLLYGRHYVIYEPEETQEPGDRGEFKPGMNLGIKWDAKVAQRLHVTSALIYGKQQVRSDRLPVRLEKLGSGQEFRLVNSENGDFGVSTTHFQSYYGLEPGQDSVSLAFNTKQTINVLHLPVLIRYDLRSPFHINQWYLTAGPSVSFTMRENMELELTKNNGYRKRVRLTNASDDLKRFNFGLEAGLGYRRQFAERWSVDLQAYYNRSLAASVESVVGKIYPFSMGLRAGLSVSL